MIIIIVNMRNHLLLDTFPIDWQCPKLAIRIQKPVGTDTG